MGYTPTLSHIGKMIIRDLVGYSEEHGLELLTDKEPDLLRYPYIIKGILLRYPIPTVYVNDENHEFIFDGSIVHAVKTFVSGNFAIPENWPSNANWFDNMTYNEIPRSLQRRLWESEVDVVFTRTNPKPIYRFLQSMGLSR